MRKRMVSGAMKKQRVFAIILPTALVLVSILYFSLMVCTLLFIVLDFINRQMLDISILNIFERVGVWPLMMIAEKSISYGIWGILMFELSRRVHQPTHEGAIGGNRRIGRLAKLFGLAALLDLLLSVSGAFLGSTETSRDRIVLLYRNSDLLMERIISYLAELTMRLSSFESALGIRSGFGGCILVALILKSFPAKSQEWVDERRA